MSALVLGLTGDDVGTVGACCEVRECALGGSLATVFADDVGEDGTVSVGDSCGGWGVGASLGRGDVDAD